MDNDDFQLANRSDNALEVIDAPRYSYWGAVFKTFFAKKSNYILLAILMLLVIMAYTYQARANYSILDPAFQKLPPSFDNPFGTNHFAERIWDLAWEGARNSLNLALICTIINMSVGIVVGSFWGYSRKFDKIMMEIYNVISNVPFLLFVLIYMYIVGPGFWSLVSAMCITGWLGVAYFIRTQVIIIRDRDYNLASKCLGTRTTRMLTKNMLPYLTSVLVTIISREIPSYISFEVFLSYLGVGLSEKEVSLGKLIQTQSSSMIDFPVQFWGPVVILAILTVSLYLIGQNLADATDPKTHL